MNELLTIGHTILLMKREIMQMMAMEFDVEKLKKLDKIVNKILFKVLKAISTELGKEVK